MQTDLSALGGEPGLMDILEKLRRVDAEETARQMASGDEKQAQRLAAGCRQPAGIGDGADLEPKQGLRALRPGR